MEEMDDEDEENVNAAVLSAFCGPEDGIPIRNFITRTKAKSLKYDSGRNY